VDGETDPYMGYKLAGGSHRSGEASYIEYINGKYYLFVTYGGLTSTGGYNMRVFSSESVTGPYVDLSGEDARYPESGNAGVETKTVGTRPMSYYRWSYMDTGFTAQGHNSAFVDTDGKAYLIYHTRFDDGTEGHEVRVHQLFTGENGELVAAPFEYAGETLSETGYDKSEVTGTYQVLYHTSSINYKNRECVTEQTITLKEDGTVTGDYTGTWTMQDGKPYVTLTTGKVAYSGVFIKQEMEETDYETMCFTLAGKNDVTIWGYRVPDDDVVVAANVNKISIPSATYGDIALTSSEDLLYDAEITWSSSNENILSSKGVVATPSVDTDVRLTATITKGSYKYEKTFTVTVYGDSQEKYDESIFDCFLF
jgi:beta-xylosidase